VVTLATNLPTVGISPWCCSACPATVSATTDAGRQIAKTHRWASAAPRPLSPTALDHESEWTLPVAISPVLGEDTQGPERAR
jgi:hypothetical protein